ncbi:MAG: hypothetical protein Q9218_006693, partial [Villophora microphyllina]
SLELQPSYQKPLRTDQFILHLHPVPRNPTPWERTTMSKEQLRRRERLAWDMHMDLIKGLRIDPYDGCICDVAGLDESCQIVQDPDIFTDYAHRPDCLAYPMLGEYKIDVYRCGTSAEYLSHISEFRSIARNKGGIKKFTKRALEDLGRQCGLRYDAESAASRIPMLHCLCDLLSEPKMEHTRPDLPRGDHCNNCNMLCCPCCKPKCHGLLPKDSKPEKCLVRRGRCCPQCHPDCHTKAAKEAAAKALKPADSFRDVPHSTKKRRTPIISDPRRYKSSTKASRPRVALSPTQSRSLPLKRKGNSTVRLKSKVHYDEDLDEEQSFLSEDYQHSTVRPKSNIHYDVPSDEDRSFSPEDYDQSARDPRPHIHYDDIVPDEEMFLSNRHSQSAVRPKFKPHHEETSTVGHRLSSTGHNVSAVRPKSKPSHSKPPTEKPRNPSNHHSQSTIRPKSKPSHSAPSNEEHARIHNNSDGKAANALFLQLLKAIEQPLLAEDTRERPQAKFGHTIGKTDSRKRQRTV